MTNRIKILCLTFLAIWNASYAVGESSLTNSQNNAIEIRSVTVDGNPISSARRAKMRLKPYLKNISIFFGPGKNSGGMPLRLRYKLDGYDNVWHEDGGEMCLTARFFDKLKNQVKQIRFKISGHSAGWQQGLTNSSLTHRREVLVVPPRASQLMIIIASTGPPSTVGVYVLTDLTVSKTASNDQSEVLLRFPFDQNQKNDSLGHTPYDWVRDGTHPTMAKVIELGEDSSSKKAFAIFDDDLTAHAEWRNTLECSPQVTPGEHIVIEWNEMYNIADGLTRVAEYQSLPPGRFRFQVQELNLMGIPTGIEASLPILVLPPVWKRPWFWALIFTGFTAAILAGARYIVRRKMRRELLHLENQRLLEQERLRIAKDIHDDLGARVTQISLVSAMAQMNLLDPERARVDFERISQMSRNLVNALYETVWAVNPTNDNLKELGNYLFQMANKLCETTQCRCRFYADDLPREAIISSHMRHNICMAVKETLHNVIKHANASEVAIRIVLKESLLNISIQDNGCGFPTGKKFAGAGLANIKQRLDDIGGTCAIESQVGHGTTINLRLVISASGS